VKPVRQSELLSKICNSLKHGAAHTRAAVQYPAPSIASNTHVLVAEDNPVNQTLVRRLLEKRGYSIIVVGNGRAALDALEQDEFDIVLMDVQMPVMDGFAATAAIREKEQATGRHMPIVAMTAHALKGDQERCLAEGMDAYVSKPIRTEDLFLTLERLLQVQ
jgi:CheY-like chemotaxis protein